MQGQTTQWDGIMPALYGTVLVPDHKYRKKICDPPPEDFWRPSSAQGRFSLGLRRSNKAIALRLYHVRKVLIYPKKPCL